MMKITPKTTGIVGWLVAARLCIKSLVPAAHAINWNPYYGEMSNA